MSTTSQKSRAICVVQVAERGEDLLADARDAVLPQRAGADVTPPAQVHDEVYAALPAHDLEELHYAGMVEVTKDGYLVAELEGFRGGHVGGRDCLAGKLPAFRRLAPEQGGGGRQGCRRRRDLLLQGLQVLVADGAEAEVAVLFLGDHGNLAHASETDGLGDVVDGGEGLRGDAWCVVVRGVKQARTSKSRGE